MKNCLPLILCALPLVSIPAAAAPVLIQNASFEIATLPINAGWGVYSNLVPLTFPTGGTLAGWGPTNLTQGNSIGAYNPELGYPNWAFAWEDGDNMGYAQAFGNGATNAGLIQILTATLQPNTTYTLSSMIGRRLFTTTPWNVSIELFANGDLLGSSINTTLGSNSVVTESFSVTIGASHPELGQQLEIRLMTNGNASEAFFDDVRLDATAIPEPGTCLFVSAGLAFITLRLRRARREH